ncbi:MAG TPA: hypothetical protein VGZ27_20015 [Vicinamibacterales bacterium]|jgi:hypothetical protein|nr:hypothetical protein [Vicinamibacterales bacterium]
MTETHSPDRAPAGAAVIGHEMSDVHVRGVLVFAAGLFVTGIVIHLLVWLFFVLLAEQQTRGTVRQYPLAVGQQERVPPAPRLQINPREDLRELRSAEDAALTSYGWVDQNGGVVRIPIDAAMKLTVQRGLPARRKP